jgi:capsular polysaccharide biosynthesis protein
MTILAPKTKEAPANGLDTLAAELGHPDARADEQLTGVFEPPKSFVLSAILGNKALVSACVVLLALIGVAAGAARKSTYTASATLQVGQVNPNSPGFYSYVQSSAALSTAFSRSIGAEPVLATIQHTLGIPPAKAVGRLSSEPIPASPAFRVIATGPTRTATIELANVAANAVIAYESKSNSSNPEAESLLHEYRSSSIELKRATVHLNHLSAAKHISAEALARAESEKAAAAVKLKATANAYISTVASQAPRSGLVSLLAGASSASSNRSAKLESYGLIGLLAGIVIGCLLAVGRERLRRRGRPGGAAAVEVQRHDDRG